RMPWSRAGAVVSLLGLMCLARPALAGEGETHWGYAGADGPGVRATLSPHYADCGRGRRQAPIDLPVVAGTDLTLDEPARLAPCHHEHVLEIRNDGHTVAVTYDDGDDLVVDGQVFRLVQYHFHAPSEHTIAGQHFPLELHLVHRAADG